MKKMLFVLIALLTLSASVFAEVNINTASQAELESLNGLGPVKAKAIIDYRKKNGNFKSVADLDAVDGIGEKTVKALGKEVTVSGKTLTKAATTATKAATK